jgi:hypothetical protein
MPVMSSVRHNEPELIMVKNNCKSEAIRVNFNLLSSSYRNTEIGFWHFPTHALRLRCLSIAAAPASPDQTAHKLSRLSLQIAALAR